MTLDTFEFRVKALGASRILAQMPVKTPTFREAEIQLAKLDRMLSKYEKDFPPQLLIDTEGKVGKNQGEVRQRVAQQMKRVNRLVRAVIEENFCQNLPNATPNKVRANVKKLVEGLNAQFYKAAVSSFESFLQRQLGKPVTFKSLKAATKAPKP